ncbi:MAG: hypothetical protein JSR31_10530 [Nitrospira sp.]|nr:hypothetical protein [Nitrospira sp.]
MLTLSDIINLEAHDQFFSYADAYLSASAVLCRQMKNDSTRYTWPHATVILMLAAHAVELFLKGALLKSTGKLSATHDIQQLAEKYRETFQNLVLTWEIPFANPCSETELIAQMKQQWPDIDEAHIKTFITSTPDPSILYRYPFDKPGKQWPGVYGFTTPTQLLTMLDWLEFDFKRIRLELNKPRS